MTADAVREQLERGKHRLRVGSRAEREQQGHATMLVNARPHLCREVSIDAKYDGPMSEAALAPRNAFHGVIAVWVVSLVGAIVLGIALPEQDRVTWLAIAFGAVILLSFAVQLGYGRAHGFIVRVAASCVGALIVMGLVSAAFGLSALAEAL